MEKLREWEWDSKRDRDTDWNCADGQEKRDTYTEIGEKEKGRTERYRA